MSVFAARMADEARESWATIQFTLGTSSVRVRRSLETLAVEEIERDGASLQPTDDQYQDLVRELSELPNLGDWIVLLR